MTIDNNIQPYNQAQVNTQNTLERISTGLQINQAADDAASLAISENLKVQASGLSQSIENANAGIALAQIGDQAISEQSNILDSVRKDLVQASTATTSDEGREALLQNIQKSLEQFNNIAEQTNFNGQSLLQSSSTDNSQAQSLQFQVGETSEDLIETSQVQSNTTGTGLDALLNQDSATFDQGAARDYLDDIDNALTRINDYRGDFGSSLTQLEASSRNLSSQYTSTSQAESLITNVDFASETSDFSKQNILAQVGAFGQAQASNITQQTVLRLLQ